MDKEIETTMGTKIGTYNISNIKCLNCDWKKDRVFGEYIKIPMGQTIDDTPCPNCGCNKIIKI